MKKNEILVVYGEKLHEMTLELLEKANLAEHIVRKEQEIFSHRNDKGGGGGVHSVRIGIKPNLVGTIPAEKGATTHPEIISALVEYLQKYSFHQILILEGSWIGDNTKRAFKALGYEDLSEKYGISLLDTKQDNFVIKSYNGIKMEISETALGLDYLINVPVLKGHCQTKITGALKNLKGIISDKEKRHFHSLGLHEPIAYLNKLICADFVLLDGICGDLDFEEGGNPVSMNRIACGLDSVLIDSYIATTMGYQPEDIRYIMIAEKIGVGSKDIRHADIRELNRDTAGVTPAVSRRVKKLSEYVDEKEACSACYANLIQALARMEDSGKLSAFKKRSFAIGQGFKNFSASSEKQSSELKIGIGSCTKKLETSVPGCPVKALDILDFLVSKK